MNKMMVILYCFWGILPLLLAEPIPPNLPNPYVILPIPDTAIISKYLVFHTDLQRNYSSAREFCIKLGGDLADVESISLLEYLAARLHGPAFTLAFAGESLMEKCGAIYPGAAVAIPWEACTIAMDFICEVPLPYNFIPPSNNKVPSSGDGTKVTKASFVQIRPNGFIKVGMDGKNEVVTETINIISAIATNPVLPCCRCCGQ